MTFKETWEDNDHKELKLTVLKSENQLIKTVLKIHKSPGLIITTNKTQSSFKMKERQLNQINVQDSLEDTL